MTQAAPEPNEEQWKQIQTELFAGGKISAIKVYRTATGCGLAEAKEAMDAYETRLRSEDPERFKSSGKSGCAGVVLLLMLVAAISAAALRLA